MKFGSVCSGIEAASVAWKPLGWEAAWFSEIEPFPCAVLAHHYPNVPNHGDMTLLPDRILSGEISAPDIFCGGTPCQAFSVAGLRRSLEDDRGNLSLTFCEIANAIDSVRSVRGEPPSIVFWENVPGVLNTPDNAFGCFLAGLAGEDDPLIPAGKKWTNAGCVFGPKRAVAWRVTDAQYFGVAQRRRRVFVVASARDKFDPAAVLFEFDGLRRDIAPSREAGQKPAPTVVSGPPFSRTGNERVEADAMVPVFIHETTGMLDRECGAGKLNHQTAVSGQIISAANQGDVRTTHAVVQPIAFQMAGDRDNPTVSTSDIAFCLPANPMSDRGQAIAHPVAYSIREDAIADNFSATELETSTAVTALRPSPQSHHAQVFVAKPIEPIPIDTMNHVGLGDNHSFAEFQPGAPSYTLTKGHSHAVALPMAVRRLTPVECERLQGFPSVRESLIIKVCGDHQNSDVLVDLKCLRSLNNVWNAEEKKLMLFAPTAEKISNTVQADQEPDVALLVHMHSEDELQEIRSQGKLIWSANGARHPSKSAQPILPANTVQEIAHMLRELVKTIPNGKVVSLPSIRLSLAEKNGKQSAEKYMQEIKGSAKDVQSDQKEVMDKCITSSLGRVMPMNDSITETLCCSVLHAISGFIQNKTEIKSLLVELTIETPYTLIPWRKKPASECPDGPRYKALGNSWAVPNVRWIGERIDQHLKGAL